ncbi:TetR/AcrR family transcriptional regulator, transcriptional repressor for nem operon [Saccharopolyspora antimicrobica]|uniref:TetR family transcriptional regulator n=1 Tax=Saccharopolyspora antimicrobica TaxID=455193 RepID=A0A1I4TEK5_9PSEU|nr:TetR/AcrR family transcriptional regulator [Saccharopolyspora antimicrobica]RKT85745.1 TetR family transcriptional regulator [Saccharopolyspora antimicrobica]SFM75218.1 TetR/AcrR family transcriptional regulator, transcriptional repressor for nem operon [Saccharopolyspora antimicrobica]
MARPRKFDEARVIDAAMDTFWRRGYEATSTRDLSETTELGPSSLYNAFGDKHGLYLRSLRKYQETATVEQVALLRAPGPVADRLRNLLTTGIDTDLSGTDRPGCFAINAAIERAAGDPDVRDEVRRNFATVEEALREVLAEGQRSGEIDPGRSAEVLARQVLSTYYGLRVLARVQPDRAALLDVVDNLLESARPRAER